MAGRPTPTGEAHEQPTLAHPGPSAPPPTPPCDTAPQRFGDYELLGEVGRGGMGVVYKAREAGLDRVVAIKMLLPGAVPDEAELQRFRTEAAAAARLQHPHIVAVHRVGEHDGRHFYSMDFIDGVSLTQRLAEGPLPGRTAARYAAVVARALHHAHQHGILHRDVKPGNVLLDGDDRPHVTDFGLAKQYNSDSNQTRTGSILGTPSYMAPEQAAGRKDLGPACDIYGVGALLYELLTGRPPFRAETPLDTMLQVMEVEPVPPRLLNPKIDRDLETVCLKCLQKGPRDRYASAAALADDLDRYLDGDSIHARSFNMMDRLARTLERSQFDVEFRTYASLLYWFAAIVLVMHVIKHVQIVLGQPIWAVAASQIAQFGLMGVVFWRYRKQGVLPTNTAERQMWSVWVGYLICCFLIALACRVMFGGARLYEGVLYPFYAITAGMAFFVLGSSYWGRCYAVGVAFFALSGVMLLRLEWATLEFGVMWTLVLVAIGRRLSRLGREHGQRAGRPE
jgi:serine/threonine protein kinase